MMRFILVDDEEMNLFICKKLLTHALGEVEITAFTSGGEALRYLKNSFEYRNRDAVILFLDINMPVVSGWDFLDFFSQFDDEVKNSVHIYILSSSIDPVDKYKAMTYPNVISFISKPLTKQFLLEHFSKAV